MFPEYYVQQTIDSESVIPIGACIESAGYDTSQFRQLGTGHLQRRRGAVGDAVQPLEPRAVLQPVDVRSGRARPRQPPLSLDDLREYSQAIVDSGAASYGIVDRQRVSAFGGWVIEQWFANAGELYADNENGHLAPATRVLYDSALGVELLTFVQQMVQDGLAYYVGGNAERSGQLLQARRRADPAAMTVGSSASLGTIKVAVDGGLIPGITGDDIGVGPLPGPTGIPTALMGGASLYVVADHGDETTAAAWDYITYLVSPSPSRSGPPTRATYRSATMRWPSNRSRRCTSTILDSRSPTTSSSARRTRRALRGPILGPQREVRVATARAVAEILDGGDVNTALTEAATQANALIADYNARN